MGSASKCIYFTKTSLSNKNRSTKIIKKNGRIRENIFNHFARLMFIPWNMRTYKFKRTPLNWWQIARHNSDLLNVCYTLDPGFSTSGTLFHLILRNTVGIATLTPIWHMKKVKFGEGKKICSNDIKGKKKTNKKTISFWKLFDLIAKKQELDPYPWNN